MERKDPNRIDANVAVEKLSQRVGSLVRENATLEILVEQHRAALDAAYIEISDLEAELVELRAEIEEGNIEVIDGESVPD